MTTDKAPGWALVTGASAGIGAEFCRQLAAMGYSVVLVARRREPMDALARDLEQECGVQTLVLPCDLSRPQAIPELVAELRRLEVTVSMLVNNAGYGVAGRFTEPDWVTHEQFLRVMVGAVCELTWHLLPDMQKRGSGHIINVASLAGLVPGSEGHTLYGASKAFLIRFSESLALENRANGVRVSALCPGFTYSEFHDVVGLRDHVSQMPDFMWQQADEVVAYALDAVMRESPRVIAVPGRVNRFVAWLSSHQQTIARWLVKRQSKRFRQLD